MGVEVSTRTFITHYGYITEDNDFFPLNSVSFGGTPWIHIYSWIWAQICEGPIQATTAAMSSCISQLHHVHKTDPPHLDPVFFYPVLLWFSLCLGGGDIGVSFNAQKIISSQHFNLLWISDITTAVNCFFDQGWVYHIWMYT